VQSQSVDRQFGYTHNIRMALFNEHLNFRREARMVVGYAAVTGRRKARSFACNFERFSHERNFELSKLVERHGVAAKVVGVNCEHLGSQGRSEVFALSAPARTVRMLAFKGSQELPAFSTVENDNRRTRSRLHGVSAAKRPRRLMRSAAHAQNYSVVIVGAAALSDVSCGQIGDLRYDHRRGFSERPAITMAQISVFLDHSAIKNNCNAKQQGNRCDRAMHANFRCWRGATASTRVSAKAIPEGETEINNGTHDHKPPLQMES
jgi:hypothetical protein